MCGSIHAQCYQCDGKPPLVRSPALKVDVHRCGGWHSHASARVVEVALSLYAVRRVRCFMPVLAVLC
jgi:hypothetical protein